MARNSLLCADVPLRNYSLTLHDDYAIVVGECEGLHNDVSLVCSNE